MAAPVSYRLSQDRKGMLWDLLLYVPTVVFLFATGLKLWFSSSQSWSYVLFFMAFFFLFAGSNRILSGRLMLFGSSPVSIACDREQISLELRNGSRVDLVKDVRFFPDYAGKSFGLAGMDLSGRRRQFVFHRGQFPDAEAYRQLLDRLALFK